MPTVRAGSRESVDTDSLQGGAEAQNSNPHRQRRTLGHKGGELKTLNWTIVQKCPLCNVATSCRTTTSIRLPPKYHMKKKPQRQDIHESICSWSLCSSETCPHVW